MDCAPEPTCEKKCTQPCSDYENPPARCCLESQGLTISASFLYWQSKVQDLPYGVLISDPTNLLQTTGEKLTANYGGDPGFNVALGINMPWDGWSFRFLYTWLSTCATGSKTSATSQILPIWLTPGSQPPITDTGFTDQASMTWDLFYNTLDLEIDRTYQISHSNTFRPFFGVRSAWIDQDIKVNYGDIIRSSSFDLRANINVDQDLWCIGPRIGFEDTWGVLPGVRLFGLLSAAFLWGDMDVDGRVTGALLAPPLPINQIQKQSEHRFSPNMQAALGVDCRVCFKAWRSSLYFKAAYELNYYWDQIAAWTFADVYPRHNLMLHGLTATLGYDF